jgi:hypothetical protein
MEREEKEASRPSVEVCRLITIHTFSTVCDFQTFEIMSQLTKHSRYVTMVTDLAGKSASGLFRFLLCQRQYLFAIKHM